MPSCRVFYLLALTVPAALPAVQVQSLTPSLASPQKVGTTITWTAGASDVDPGTLDYRFSVKLGSAANYTIIRDFHPSPTLEWTQASQEGTYQIRVTARNRSTQKTGQKVAPFKVAPEAGVAPVVTPTSNPLVFLYSAPACATGSSIRARFQVSGASRSDITNTLACNGQTTMNFYVAGLRPLTGYVIRHELITGSTTTPGPSYRITTGALPPALLFPGLSISLARTSQSSSADSVILFDNLLQGSQVFFPAAVDLTGTFIWYYDRVARPEQSTRFFLRPLEGGNLLINVNDTSIPDPVYQQNQIFREIDLAGNTVRETNVTRVAEQLIALHKTPITSFHHDAVRLANGHTLLLGSTEKIFPAGTQNAPGPINILGDTVVELDQNLQVVWVWESYDYMDVNRAAVMGETCVPLGAGCPPLSLGSPANDWLHSNSLHLTADGNVLVSMRDQDLVIKIQWARGAGNGTILWKLGNGGDFAMTSAEPYPWFSHQHDAGYEGSTNQYLSLYDNGNTRNRVIPNSHSRGQVLSINEAAKTVSLALNVDLGVFSLAVGNAQRLSNGNYHFHSGFVNYLTPPAYSNAAEFTASATPAYTLRSDAVSYRSYRMTNLYTPPAKY